MCTAASLWSGATLSPANSHPLQNGPRSRAVVHGPGLTEDLIGQREALAESASNPGGHPAGGWKWNPEKHGPMPV